MPDIQNRIQRTYEVSFNDLNTGDTVVSTRVNLSYELNEAFDAITREGYIVEPQSISAKTEAVRRIRHLALKGHSNVTPEQVETLDWNVKLVSQRHVEVPLDDNGRPIPRRP